VTAVVRADMPAAQLERIRRRDREATRRRRAIARGLPDPGPVSDLFTADRRLGLPEGLPVLGKWILRAACRDKDPDLWFSTAPADAGKAQAICAWCPVCSQCSAGAEANAELYGVWGGTDRDQARTAS
jgi:WhiB family transcriptional regulator, redox-sensing transcriptional regulator